MDVVGALGVPAKAALAPMAAEKTAIIVKINNVLNSFDPVLKRVLKFNT
jgi:hypothetical protein